MFNTVPGAQSVLYKYHFYYCQCSINVAIFNTRENYFYPPKRCAELLRGFGVRPLGARFAGQSTASVVGFKDLRFPEVIHLRGKKEVGGGKEGGGEPDGV